VKGRGAVGQPERTLGKRTVRVAALAVLVALTATGCSGDEILRFGWPVGVTHQADQMRTLWTWTVVAALVVGVIVWGLIFWTATFHRKKKTVDGEPEELPRQFQYNIPLELFTVVVPTIMVCVLFFFTATTESKVLDKIPNPDVRLTAHSVDHPLPDVALKMKHQITNRVLVRCATVPDQVVVQLTQASFDVPGHLFQFLVGMRHE